VEKEGETHSASDETQSLRDEATQSVGVKKKLLVTNAECKMSKKISDIQECSARGAVFLIGTRQLRRAGARLRLAGGGTPSTSGTDIDRKITATGKDYPDLLGSNCRAGGKRAAERAYQRRPAGQGKVSLLIGLSLGNKRNTDSTSGFVT